MGTKDLIRRRLHGSHSVKHQILPPPYSLSLVPSLSVYGVNGTGQSQHQESSFVKLLPRKEQRRSVRTLQTECAIPLPPVGDTFDLVPRQTTGARAPDEHLTPHPPRANTGMLRPSAKCVPRQQMILLCTPLPPNSKGRGRGSKDGLTRK